MIFTLFTGIVFLSELIIAFVIIKFLFKFDKNITSTNKYLTDSKNNIESISKLIKGISEQIYELTPLYVEKMKSVRNKIIIAKFSGLLTSIFFLSINIKAIKKIRKSKAFKIALKGLSLMENMV